MNAKDTLFDDLVASIFILIKNFQRVIIDSLRFE